MTVRVLCTGDIHIGRSASKVRETYRCSQAWSKIVDVAIEEGVDLLAISGDVVDKESKSYEAIGALQDGLRRLAAHGIDTVAIAGNHDYDVLPRVASIAGTDRFHFLGRGGKWESITISRNGERSLHVVGWSFPQEHVHVPPLQSFPRLPDDGVPVLGLVHGEVGNTRSHYGPIVADELWAQRVDFWLLGHIHVSQPFNSPSGARALYPGSPFAMDPGEGGIHGVWLATFSPGKPVAPELIAISPVRYISSTVDLSGVSDETEFQEAITNALVNLGSAADSHRSNSYLTSVSCRIRLVGSSPAHGALSGWADQARRDLSPMQVGSVSVLIDEITTNVRPPISLEQLAAGNDPAGETARLLIALDSPDLAPAYADLVKRTSHTLGSVYQHSGYAAVRAAEDVELGESPGDAEARQFLVEQGWRLLSTLIETRENA